MGYGKLEGGRMGDDKKYVSLSESHWLWTYGLLKALLPLIRYIYVTAFDHGVKHGKQIRPDWRKG